MKTTLKVAMAVLTMAGTAHAANWQTPAEAAMQLAAAEPKPAEVTVAPKSAQPAYFSVTSDDVAKEVSRQMALQGFKDGVKATVNTGGSTPVLATADHPLKLVLHALQVDTDAKIWQAQAHIVANGKTEVVKPVGGRYDAVTTVPVLVRQVRKGDVIAEADIEFKSFADRQLRKDTITDTAALIGRSPTRIISAGRPLRSQELTSPTMVKKGQTVNMIYTTPYMSIRTTGQALEDGGAGSLIRVQNTKSDKAVSGRVVANGQIEVNPDAESAL